MYLRILKTSLQKLTIEKIDKLTELQKELFEERAAIKEYDGNIPREEAERQALSEIIK